MNHISEVQAGAGVSLYQLKITLKWSQPPIWRRVVVRADMTLNRLHNVIQVAMGWTNSHLHQFIAGRGCAVTYYGKPDPEFPRQSWQKAWRFTRRREPVIAFP